MAEMTVKEYIVHLFIKGIETLEAVPVQPRPRLKAWTSRRGDSSNSSDRRIDLFRH